MADNLAQRATIVRAVHPNEGTRTWYECKLRDLLDAMHESLQLHIAAAWKENPPTIGFAQDDANSAIALKRATTKWGKLWVDKFNAMSSDIAQAFANKNFAVTESSVRAAFKDAGFTVAFRPTKQSIEAYHAIAAENVNLIKSIAPQFLKDVQTAVFDSVMRGGDLSTLSRNIRQKYGVSRERAALISRDQNAKAKAVIENVRRQQLGIDTAIWQHSGAGKHPRPTHVAMDGKRYKLTKGMWDPAIGQWIWPGTEINCRCTSSAIIPGFEL